jgi:hypothetical protein
MVKKISAEEFIRKHNIRTHNPKKATVILKGVNKRSSNFEELKEELYTSHNIDERCVAIKKIVESEDPRGREVLHKIIDPKHLDPNFYSKYLKTIKSSINHVSKKKGYSDLLNESLELENGTIDPNSVIELFYDHLEAVELVNKEYVSQKIKELMSIVRVYPFLR